MAKSGAVLNRKVYLGGFDLSGAMSATALKESCGALDATAYGDGTRVRQGGLRMIALNHEGFFEANADGTATDDVLSAQLALAGVPSTIIPQTGADGEVAYTFLAIEAQYSPGGRLNEMLRFSAAAEASAGAAVVADEKNALVRGTILAAKEARVADGSGVARQLGAATAAQRVYAALHLFDVAGGAPSVTVTVESDDASGMLSPTSRLVLPALTARGSTWKSLAGAVTDTWWRVSWDLSVGTTSATFAVVVGIR